MVRDCNSQPLGFSATLEPNSGESQTANFAFQGNVSRNSVNTILAIGAAKRLRLHISDIQHIKRATTHLTDNRLGWVSLISASQVPIPSHAELFQSHFSLPRTHSATYRNGCRPKNFSAVDRATMMPICPPLISIISILRDL